MIEAGIDRIASCIFGIDKSVKEYIKLLTIHSYLESQNLESFHLNDSNKSNGISEKSPLKPSSINCFL